MKFLRTLFFFVFFQVLVLLSVQAQMIQKLQAPSYAREFGKVIAIDGATAIVGAPGLTGVGYAYIFEQQNNSWSQITNTNTELQAPSGEASTNFGASVDVSGDMAVVGDPDANGGLGLSFVFIRDATSGNWEHVETLFPPPVQGLEQFGIDVAIHNRTVVVSLIHNPPPPTTNEDNPPRFVARAYIFDNDFFYTDYSISVDYDSSQSDWSKLQVDISSNYRIAIGNPNGGKVYVADSIVGGNTGEISGWSINQTIVKATNSDFGTSIAIEGDLMVVGAPNLYSGSGATYVFDQLVETAELRPTRSYNMLNERFGHVVSLDGTTIVVGNYFDATVNGITWFPAVYLFELEQDTNHWQEKIRNSGPTNNAFGQAVAVSNGSILVGADKDISDRGSLYTMPATPLITATPPLEAGVINRVNFGDILTEPPTVIEGVAIKHNYTGSLNVRVISTNLQGTGNITFDPPNTLFSNLNPLTEKNLKLTLSPAVGGKYLVEAYTDFGDALFKITTLVPIDATISPPEPDIWLDPSTINLGNVILGQSKNVSLQIENRGTGQLDIGDISFQNLVNVDAVDSFDPIQLMVGTNAEVILTFTATMDPASAGPISGQIIIDSNDSDQPVTQLTISGMAQTPPQIAIDTISIDLGNLPVADPNSDNALTLQQTLTIQNTGQATLHVNRIELYGLTDKLYLDEITSFMVPDQNSGPQSGPGEYSLPLNFTPQSRGAFSGQLKIFSGDSPEVETTETSIAISGTGVAPLVSITPATTDTEPVNFGIVGVDLERRFQVTIQNSGDIGLNLTSIELDAISLSNNGIPVDSSQLEQTLNIDSTIYDQSTIASNSQATISLILIPKQEGDFSGRLILKSDAYNGDQWVYFSVKVHDQFIKIDEDQLYQNFSLEVFQAFYQNIDVPEVFESIKIKTLSEQGTLKLTDTVLETDEVILIGNINQLVFQPNPNFYGTAIFEYAVNNQELTNPFLIIIQSINDAPTVLAETNLIVAEDIPLPIFSASNYLQDYDYDDAEEDDWFNLKLISVPAIGRLELNGTELSVDGSLAADQLDDLVYVSAENWNSNNALAGEIVTFQFVVNDNSVNGQNEDGSSSNPFSSPATVNINVTPVNDAPTVQNETVITDEDLPYTFTLATFNSGYQDQEADNLANIKIESLPQQATLDLLQPDNSPQTVAIDQVIGSQDLNRLQLTPDSNWNGNTSFSFSLNDNSVNNQNEDGSSFNPFSSTATVNINIMPVNDAPTMQNGIVSTDEDLPYTFTLATFNVGYQDQESNSLANIKIKSLPQQATLDLLQPDNSLQAVEIDQVIGSQQINQLQLTPDNNWHGNTSFSFSLNDNSVNNQNEDGSSFNPFSSTATVNITVSPINDPPSFDLSATTVTVDEDFTEIQTITLIANVVPTDEIDQIVNYVLTPVGIDFANVIFDETQLEITISSISNKNGSQQLTITATETRPDGSGLVNNTAQQTVTLTVNPVNDPPTVQDQTVTTQEDQIYLFQDNDFKNNYQDTEQKALANVKIVSLPTTETGQLKLSDGQDQWTNVSVTDVIAIDNISRMANYPAANWNGDSSFQFSVNDIEGGNEFYSQPKMLTITIEPVNDAPTVGNHLIEILEDQHYDFTSSDFQQDYFDIENDSFSALEIISQPAVSVDENQNQIGGELYFNSISTSLTTFAKDQISNLRFQPAEHWFGSISLTFRVKDNGTTSHPNGDIQTLTFTVIAQNDPPTFSLSTNTIVVDEDFDTAEFVTIPQEPIPYQEDGQSVSYQLEPPTVDIANIVFNSNSGEVGITAKNNQFGSQTFTITATETESGSPNLQNFTASQTFTLTVTPKNDLPIISGFDKTIDEDQEILFTVSDFMTGMTDVEQDPLTYLKIDALPSNGNLILDESNPLIVPEGQIIPVDQIHLLRFKPNQNWYGETIFGYSLSDVVSSSNPTENDWSSPATVTIIVNQKNDAPEFTFEPSELTLVEDFTGNEEISIISSAPADESGQPVVYALLPASVDFATILFDSSNKKISVSALPNQFGNQELIVTATEPDAIENQTATVSVMLTVTSINDPPTISSYVANMFEDQVLEFNSSFFNSDYADIEGDAIDSVQILSLPENGQLQLNGIEIIIDQIIPISDIDQLNYAPNVTWSGTDSFDFRVNDSGVAPNLYSDTQTITLNVAPINNAPVIEALTITTNEDETYDFKPTEFSAIYQDEEENQLAHIKIETLPDQGELYIGEVLLTADLISTSIAIISLENSDQLSFSPPANWNSTANQSQLSFDFSVNDDGDAPNPYSQTQTITVIVDSINDPPIFSLDTELIEVHEDFENPQIIKLIQLPVPDDEIEQSINYRLFPSEVDFAQLSIDEKTGTITITTQQNLDGDENIDVIATEYQLNQDNELIEVGENSTFEATFTLIVNSVNDSPDVENVQIEIYEDETYAFNNVEFEFKDVEADELATIKILTLPENGQLLFDEIELQPVEGKVEATIDLDNLDSLTFQPSLNWFGETSFQVSVNDDGQTVIHLNEQGQEIDEPPYSETVSISIKVTALNDPPTISEPTIQTEENLAYTFNVDDFKNNYTDAEDNDLAYLKIEILPENGQLLLDELEVDSAQIIPVDQLNKLQFIPVEDWFGTTEFGCSLSDDGEILESEDYAPFSQLISILIAVSEDNNQSPELTALLIPPVKEGESVNFTLVDFIDLDPREGEVRLANINWGDENEDIEVEVILEDPQTGQVIFPHTFKNEGVYSVQVTVLDERGGVGTETLDIEVQDEPPTFVVSQDEVNGQEGLAIDLADFEVYLSDLGTEDNHTITINWGEEESEPISVENIGLQDELAPVTLALEHTYSDSGTYTITLIATDTNLENSQSEIELTAKIENLAPVISEIVVSPDIIAEGEEVTLLVVAIDSEKDQTILEYAWDFGDQSLITESIVEPSAMHTFKDSGIFEVKLVVNDDDGGISEKIIEIEIENSLPEITQLPESIEIEEGTPLNLIPVIIDAGQEDRHTLSWDFGDESPNIETDEVDYAYQKEGQYLLTLTVADDNGGEATQTIEVTVTDVPIRIIEIQQRQKIEEGMEVEFDLKLEHPTNDFSDLTYIWNFGDDSPTKQETESTVIKHTYADNGNFEILVKIENEVGQQVQLAKQIKVDNLPPEITKFVVPKQAKEGQELNFSAIAVDPAGDKDILLFSWDFGDGSDPIIGDNVTYSFGDNGIFEVVLTVTDDEGLDTIEKAEITIKNVVPQITEFAQQSEVDEGVQIGFSVLVSEPGRDDKITYVWDFGDGTKPETITGSNISDITHIYTDNGEFELKLSITDDDGGKHQKSKEIIVKNVAPFVKNPPTGKTVKEGDQIIFSVEVIDAVADLSTLTYIWDFGDKTDNKETPHILDQPVTVEHVYTKNGEFPVKLTVIDKDGAEVEKIAKVVVQNVEPVIVSAPESTTGNEGEALKFSALAEDFSTLTYVWDFGDGSEVLSDIDLTEVVHTYLDNGKYKLTLSVTDVNQSTVTRTVDITINNLPPEIQTAPENISINEGESIQANIKAVDPAGDVDQVSYNWDFGDRSGGIQNQEEIEYSFKKKGSYTVTVTAQDDDGGVVSHQFTVDVRNLPPEIETLVSNKEQINEGESVKFTAQAVDLGRLLYEWDFGDNSTIISGANLNEVEHTFLTDGNYTVKLTVTDTDEATNNRQLDVEVDNLPPKAIIDVEYIINEGEELTLDASQSIDPGQDELFFEWDLDGDGQIDEEGVQQIYNAEQIGQYDILLVVSEKNDPEAKDQIQISLEVLNILPTISAGGPYSGELGEDVLIDGATAQDPSDPTGETFTYAWDLDDDGTFETKERQPIFSNEVPGSYTIHLQVQEKVGEPIVTSTIVAIQRSGNEEPIAKADRAETNEDEPVIITVLVNDSDPDAADPTQSELTVISSGSIADGHGHTEINPDGSITYTPGQDADQDDAFTYTISDPNGGLASATVTITINPINDEPVAQDDSFSLDEDTPLNFTILDLVKNDVDPDTSAKELVLESVSSRSARGINIDNNGNGTFTYQPKENFFGQDSFSYIITDGQGGSSGATVDLIIEPVNDPPIPTADLAELPEDTQGYPIDVLINDTDADGDKLIVLSVSETQNGQIDLDTMTYIPNSDFSGEDQFTYTVSDGKGQSAEGNVTIKVMAVNDLPVAVKKSIATDEDTSIELTLEGKDADKDDLLYEIFKEPLNGKLDGDRIDLPFANGKQPKFIYRPNNNYYGEDYFSFRVSDNNSSSLVAKVSITINSVYDPPQFVTTKDEISGQYKTGQPIETLIRVINFEEEELTYTTTGLPSTVVNHLRPVLGGVVLKWLPTYAQVGSYDVTLKAGESELEFSMEIVPVNRTPQLDPIDNIVDNNDKPSISVPLQAYDPDPESKLTFKISRLGANGDKPVVNTPTLKPDAENGGTSATASMIWEPDMSKNGGRVTEFILTVSDEKGLQAKHQFSIGLGEVNTPPSIALEQTVYNVRESIRSALQSSQNRLLGNAKPSSDDTVLIQFQAQDAEKDKLRFEADSLPEGSSLEEETGLFTWMPDTKAGDGPGGAKIWTLLFRVVEDRQDKRESLYDEISVRIRVKDRNILPVLLANSQGKLKTIDQIPDQVAKEGQKLVVPLQALDYDGDKISFILSGMPLGAKVINISPGRAKFEWTPPFDAAGRKPIEVLVKALDAKGAVTTREQSKFPNSIPFNITVENTNQSPKLIGELVDQSIDEGKALQFPLVFTDPDLAENPEETISLTLENTPAASEGLGVAQVIDNGNGTGAFSWQMTFESSIPAGYQPIVVATDSQGARTEVSFQIIVRDVNRPPQFGLVEVPPRIVEGDEIVIPLRAKDLDNPDEPLHFSARIKGGELKDQYQVAGSDLLLYTRIGDAGAYTAKLSVFDSQKANSDMMIDLIIRPRNLPPIIEKLPPAINVIEGEDVKLAVAFEDPNENKLQTNFQIEPKVSETKFETGLFQWATKVGAVGQYKLTFSVSETETTEKFKAIATTQIIVAARGKINISNAQVKFTGGIVQIGFDLDVGKGGRADVDFAVEVKGKFLPIDSLKQLPTTNQVSYEWDSRISKNGVPVLGLINRPYYRLRLIATDGKVSSPPVIIGPVLIDNQPPKLSLPKNQSAVTEAGTGNVALIDVVAVDNDQISQLQIVFVDRTERANLGHKPNVYQAQVIVPSSPIDLMRSAGITSITLDMLANGIDYPYHFEATDLANNKTLFPPQKDKPLILRLKDTLPPIAEITPKSMIVSQGTEITLNGRDSSDNSQRVIEYMWDLDDNDGINFDEHGITGKIVKFTASKSVLASLRVKDPAGNTGTQSIPITVIDKTPPNPPTFNSFKPAIISERQATIYGLTEPRAEVEILVQGTTQLTQLVTADVEGNFSLLIENLEDSTYKIGGTATDTAGNTSLQAQPVTLIVDTVPPQVNIVFDVQPVAGQANRLQAASEIANVRPQIPIEITDRGGLAFIDLFLLEGYAEVSLDGGKRRSGRGGFNLTEKVIPLRDLVDGATYQVKVVALDLAQQRTETKMEFRINRNAPDRTAPQVVFTSPGIEGMFTGNANLPIQVNLSDAESGLNLNLEHIKLNLAQITDGKTIPIQDFSLDSSDSKSARLMTFPLEPLPTGQYSISITVQDQNENIKQMDRSFQVLGIPPTPTIPQLNRLQEAEPTNDVQGTSNQYIKTSTTTIEGQLDITFMPGGGVVEFFVNGNVVTTAPIDALTGNYVAKVPLVEGKNEIMLVAVNVIRKKSSPSAPTHLVLDTQSPIFEALEPTNGAVLKQVNEIRAVIKDSTVISSAISGVDISSLEITLDNQLLPANDDKTPDIDGWQYDILSGQLIVPITTSLGDQTSHTIKIQLADRLGNLVVGSSIFKIETDLEDTTKPVVSGVSPTEGSTVNGDDLADPEFALRGSAYDIDSGLAEVQIRLDGKTIDSKIFAYRSQQKFEDPGKIEFRPDTITDGDHLLTIYARDKSGNEKLVHSKFIVDSGTLKPVLTPLPQYLSKRRVLLTGTAEPLAQIQILVNQKPAGTVFANDEGKFSQAGLALDEGSNIITAIASDKGNNVSPPAESLSVLADIRQPLVGNPEPKPGINLSQSAFTIGADLGDNPGGSGIDIASIQLILDGNKNLYEFDYDLEKQRISYTPAGDSTELTEFAEGSHAFRIVVSDLAGNTTTFNSGQFWVNFTPPTISQNLPQEGDILSNGEIEITILSEEKDLSDPAFSLRLVTDKDETIPIDQEYEHQKGRLRVQPQKPLEDGEYAYHLTATDLAGNQSKKTVHFKIDSQVEDDSPPTIMPQFPRPGQEVSSTSFMAMEFQVVDSDSQVGFEEMSVEINGVVYNELFGPGSANRFNRNTGDVILYARLQLELGGLEDPLELGGLEDPLELGGLEDPLELGGLEDPLELGGLEDPLELGGLEDPLELGGLEDPLELGGLEDPLELGALERPLELATGLNAVSITVPDMTGNFSQFTMNFDVTLESPTAPEIMAEPPPPPLAPGIERRFGAFYVGQVGIMPHTVRAGEAFDISFNANQDVVAAFLDLAQLDSTLPQDEVGLGQEPPPWADDSDKKTIWEQIKTIPQERPDLDIDLFKLFWLKLDKISPKPYAVPAKAERYQAISEVSESSQIIPGDKTIRLFVVTKDADSEQYWVDYRQIFVGFENPKVDGGKNTNRQQRGRQASRLFTNRMVSSATNQEDQIAIGDFEFEAYFIEINEKNGKVYTNTPEVPLVGQMTEEAGGRQTEVEIFVNDNTMGIANVSPSGVFTLPRILLDDGTNKVTAFSRSESQLQSPVSPPMVYFLDQEAPKVKFVELPTHASLATQKINILYQDNSNTTPQSITLVLNDVAMALDVSTSESELTIDLADGTNNLGLSAIDLAGNVSEVVETTLTLSTSPPQTAPTDLKGGLGFSGSELVIRWTADANAQSYNVYRAESEIFDATFLKPFQPKLSRTTFTDVNVDLGTTYFYALTSISPSGLPGAVTSENINVTIISASKGGTAALADGTRFSAKRRAISRDATLFTAVSLLSVPDNELPLLPGAIENTGRQFRAISQSGDFFNDKFSKSATVAIAYPQELNPADLSLFRLVDGKKWEQISNAKIDEQKETFIFSTKYFGTYRLSGSVGRPWDINADGRIDIQDLVTVANNFSQIGANLMGDVNADEVVNIQDLVTVAIHFGEVYEDQPATAPQFEIESASIAIGLEANISNSSENISSQMLELTINTSKIDANCQIAGYQFDLDYDPYLLTVVSVDRSGDQKLDRVKPLLEIGKIKNVTGLCIDNQVTNSTQAQLAQIVFRLKGPAVEAVNSIRVQNLALADTDSKLIPVYIKTDVNYDEKTPTTLTFELGQNYPNPFNPETWIPYQLPTDAEVEIEIYNATGVLVRGLKLGLKSAGNYTTMDRAAYWNGHNQQGEQVASGLYFYRLKASLLTQTDQPNPIWQANRKMIVLK